VPTPYLSLLAITSPTVSIRCAASTWSVNEAHLDQSKPHYSVVQHSSSFLLGKSPPFKINSLKPLIRNTKKYLADAISHYGLYL